MVSGIRPALPAKPGMGRACAAPAATIRITARMVLLILLIWGRVRSARSLIVPLSCASDIHNCESRSGNC
jgi:hypothetical protein